MTPFFGRMLGGGSGGGDGGGGGPVAFPPTMAIRNTGSSGKIILPASSVISAKGGWTIEAWVKQTARDTFSPIFSAGTWNELNYYINSNGFPVLYLGDGSTTAIPLNTWAHVAVVSTGTERRWYVNGVLVHTSSSTFSGAISGTARTLFNDNAGDWLNGYLAEVRVWSTQRSDAQILANWNKRLVGNEAGLVLNLRMDDGSGTNVNDLSPSNADGTMSGTLTWVANP